MKRQTFVNGSDEILSQQQPGPPGSVVTAFKKRLRKPVDEKVLTAEQARTLSNKKITDLESAEFVAAKKRCWAAIRRSIKAGKTSVDLDYGSMNPYDDEADRALQAHRDFAMCRSNFEPLGYRYTMSGLFFKKIVSVEWR